MIVLLSENEVAIVNGVIVENNPFYRLRNKKIILLSQSPLINCYKLN